MRHPNPNLITVPPLLNDKRFRAPFTFGLGDPEGLKGPAAARLSIGNRETAAFTLTTNPPAPEGVKLPLPGAPPPVRQGRDDV